MKRANLGRVEDLLRHHDWPAPPPGLRDRVLSEASMAAGPIARSDRATSVRAWRPGLVLGVLAALFLAAGACTAFDVWAGRRLDEEVARVEMKVGSLDWKATAPVPVPADDNRARVVRAAAAVTVPLKNSRDGTIGLRVSSPVPAELRAFADANRAAVRMAREIGARRQSNWEVDYAIRGERPPWMEIRTLSEAILVSALLEIESAHLTEASTTIASGLAVAASLRQEPDLIAQLMRIAFANRQIGALRQLVTQSEPSKTALEDLGRWLAESRTPNPISVALAGEIRRANAVFAQMERGRVEPDIGQFLYPETWPSVPASWYGPMALIGRPVVRQAHAQYLRETARLIDVQSGPRPRPAIADRNPPARWALTDRLVEKFAGGIESVLQAGDDFDRELGLAELAVALRRYRLDRGAYPDALFAVVPAYIASVPVDPYTGRPPLYSREGIGFTLRTENADPNTLTRWALEWIVSK